jgi:hypothetical protein
LAQLSVDLSTRGANLPEQIGQNRIKPAATQFVLEGLMNQPLSEGMFK